MPFNPNFDSSQLSAGDYNRFQADRQNYLNSQAASQYSAMQAQQRAIPDVPPEVMQAQQLMTQYDPAHPSNAMMAQYGAPQMAAAAASGQFGSMPDYRGLRDNATRQFGQNLLTGNDQVAIQQNPLFNDNRFLSLPRELQAPVFQRATGHPMDMALQASQMAAQTGNPNMTYADIGASQMRDAQQKAIIERYKGMESMFGHNRGEAALYWEPSNQQFTIPGKLKINPQTQEQYQEPAVTGYMSPAEYHQIMSDAGRLTGGTMQSLPEHLAAQKAAQDAQTQKELTERADLQRRSMEGSPSSVPQYAGQYTGHSTPINPAFVAAQNKAAAEAAAQRAFEEQYLSTYDGGQQSHHPMMYPRHGQPYRR